MSENPQDTIIIKKSELEYVYAALDILNDIGKELMFKEPSFAVRIANLSVIAKNTIRDYLKYEEDY